MKSLALKVITFHYEPINVVVFFIDCCVLKLDTAVDARIK